MATAATDLAKKMRARAESDALGQDHPMRQATDALDRAVKGFYGTPQTVAVRGFMRVWEQARTAWVAYSGEPPP